MENKSAYVAYAVAVVVVIFCLFDSFTKAEVVEIKEIICRAGVEEDAQDQRRVPGAGKLGKLTRCYINGFEGESIDVLFVE
jgi:hypothetical protein